MDNNINDIVKQFQLIQRLGDDERYKTLVILLEEVLNEYDILGFSAYKEDGNLKTSLYFDEDSLHMPIKRS